MSKRPLIILAAIFAGLAVCGGLIDGCANADQASKPTATASAPGFVVGTPVPEASCNGTGCRPDTFSPSPAAPTTAAKPPAPTKPAAPALTLSQINAVAKAKEYLAFESFSLKGLTKQLEYEGFSHADASYGASHSGADWNAQAVAKAKEYLQMESFSRSGLIKQLEYEGFTAAQAQHGATGAGL